MSSNPEETNLLRDRKRSMKDTKLSPDEQVLAWRQAEFRRMGFVDFVADFLATTHIDLSEMEHLLKQDCPNDVACRILIGTDCAGDDPHWQWTDEEALEALLKPEPEPVLVS